MKILQLRFKNLNSLQGEWLIDFSDPEYISGGIFALTGPTGAGKSTILDAICLALYGATPRLGKITQSNNEIMSRHTGECFAEVIFESQSGVYQCHWSQRRAFAKPTGKLADPEQSISEANASDASGKILESKRSLVPRIIEEKTGMDFDRFTRSILLAQGGFDTFLKANAEQKSKILEQITGTEIYSKISLKVFERNKEENTKLTTLQAETSGITILEPEQQQQIQDNIEQQQKQELTLAKTLKETEQAINWLILINGLKDELGSFIENEKQLNIEIKNFKPKQQQLNLANKAAEFTADFTMLKSIRQQQTDDTTSLKNHQHLLPQLEKAFLQQTNSLQLSEQQNTQAKQKLTQASPLLKQVRLLDQKLEQQQQSINEIKTTYQNDVTKIESNNKQQRAIEKQADKNHKLLKTIKQYLQQHIKDEYLVSGFSGIEQQLNQLLLKQKDISTKENEIKNGENSLQQSIEKFDKASMQVKLQQQQLEQITLSLEQANTELANILDGKLLREYQAEKESLLTEKLLRTTIAKLEDHRAQLVDGDPCPLCGAIEHPFAKGNIPLLDETEKNIQTITNVINKVQQQEQVIHQIKEQKNQALMLLQQNKNLSQIAESEKQSAQQKLTQLTDELQITQTEFTTLMNRLSTQLQALDIEFKDDEKIDVLIKSLQQRLQKWQQHQQQKNQLEKELANYESEIKHLNSLVQSQEIELAEKHKNLTSLENEYLSNQQQRLQLFADKNTDEEEIRLNKAISDAEQQEKQARISCDQAKQQLQSTQTILSSLTQDVEKRATELAQLEERFIQALVSKDFVDEKHLLACMLSTENRHQLELKAKQLDKSQTELSTKIKDRQIRLETELAKKMSDKTLEQLQIQLTEDDEKLTQLREQISQAKHQLDDNIRNKKLIKEKQISIDAQKKECLRWANLSSLIGSADGKKYRNFAQGLTFELMVTHANQQLAKMTDRYLLTRDDKQGLELNVIDNYQAGEIRSCKNLSGGESFIVSLTLALGLSKMASQKVRVDSLFLDEGFGTLDEDTLETALETLAGLQQDGKLIGVISHVSALKERIRTQINISPLSGGKSSISGPGCQQIKS